MRSFHYPICYAVTLYPVVAKRLATCNKSSYVRFIKIHLRTGWRSSVTGVVTVFFCDLFRKFLSRDNFSFLFYSTLPTFSLPSLSRFLVLNECPGPSGTGEILFSITCMPALCRILLVFYNYSSIYALAN